MKKLFLLGMVLLSGHLFAQDNNLQQTMKNKKIKLSGYGAAAVSMSEFNNEAAAFGGLYGGVFINHRLMIGAGGYALLSHHESVYAEQYNKRTSYYMGYGGLMVEYTLFSNKLVHLTANSLFGAGGISRGYNTGKNEDDYDWKDIEHDDFYVIQPSVYAEANVTSWFRVGIGGSYRAVMGSDMKHISNKNMSAPSANLSFKFGRF